MVVDDLLVELNLVELCELEVEVVVLVVVERGGVGRVPHRAVGLDERVACEDVRRVVVFRHSDVEVARDALILLKLVLCPLLVVDELLECLLEVVKDTRVGALDLVVVDGHFCFQFLGDGEHWCECRECYEE